MQMEPDFRPARQSRDRAFLRRSCSVARVGKGPIRWASSRWRNASNDPIGEMLHATIAHPSDGEVRRVRICLGLVRCRLSFVAMVLEIT